MSSLIALRQSVCFISSIRILRNLRFLGKRFLLFTFLALFSSNPTKAEIYSPISDWVHPLEYTRPVEISAIYMIDTEEGWAFEGIPEGRDHVLRTSDGGLTWFNVTPPEPPPSNKHKTAFGFFLDSETAWIAHLEIPQTTGVVIWRTFDGGQSWQSSAITGSSGGDHLRIQFVDADHGWINISTFAGFGHMGEEVYRTQDGGKQWERVMQDLTVCWKSGMAFAESGVGWLTNECHGFVEGVIVEQTTDGGIIWEILEIPEPENAPEPGEAWSMGAMPFLFSPQSGAFVLQYYYSNSTRIDEFLYYTTDGGQTWDTRPFPGGVLQLVDENVGWAILRGIIYRTIDGGETWVKMGMLDWCDAGIRFSFIDDLFGWATIHDEDGETLLMHTTDGGQSWGQIEPQMVLSQLFLPIVNR